MKEVRYHKLKASTVIGSKDKPTTWDVGLWSLATLKDHFSFFFPFFGIPSCFLEKCLTNRTESSLKLFDAGLPAWLASSSVWQSCYAPASLPGIGDLVPKNLRDKLVIENNGFLRISQKGIFSPVFFRHSAFFLWDLYIFLLEMLESCFAPFEWMLCVCIQRIFKSS